MITKSYLFASKFCKRLDKFSILSLFLSIIGYNHTFGIFQDGETEEDPWGGVYCLGLITTTLLCCVPCSIVGLTNVIVARSEYHRGSKERATKRKESGMCCIFIALLIGIGLTGTLGVLVYRSWPEIEASQTYRDIKCLYFTPSSSDCNTTSTIKAVTSTSQNPSTTVITTTQNPSTNVTSTTKKPSTTVTSSSQNPRPTVIGTTKKPNATVNTNTTVTP